MRWSPGHRSTNVEDRRGGGGRFIRGAGGMGVGTLVILLILSLIFKRDFFSLVGAGGVGTAPETAEGPPAETTPEEERLVSFVSFVLDDAQNVWQQQMGTSYRPAKLVLFRDAVQSACGFAESATGPFYCPGDEKVYIDLGFYEELQQRFGAPGDFAQAYVLAHEIGHHVQNVLGTEAEVRRVRQTRAALAN
jgi:predicted metalloprotease